MEAIALPFNTQHIVKFTKSRKKLYKAQVKEVPFEEVFLIS